MKLILIGCQFISVSYINLWSDGVLVERCVEFCVAISVQQHFGDKVSETPHSFAVGIVIVLGDKAPFRVNGLEILKHLVHGLMKIIWLVFIKTLDDFTGINDVGDVCLVLRVHGVGEPSVTGLMTPQTFCRVLRVLVFLFAHQKILIKE